MHQDDFAVALRWIGGVAAATLPKRWWPAVEDHVPVAESASIAAILTIFAAGAIGIPGFLDFTTDQVSRNNQALLRAAQREAAKPVGQETVSERDWGQMFLGASGLSFFTFIFMTPAGWACTYLGVSGTVRAIASAVDDPFGDPILTGLDALANRSAVALRARLERADREAREGQAVPDVIVPGEEVGLPDVEVVIVSARRKPGWDAGTVVDTGEVWYRVGAIEERVINGRLRTLYPLTEHKDLEVFRRSVRYDFMKRS